MENFVSPNGEIAPMPWVSLHRRAWSEVSGFFRAWRDTSPGFAAELLVVGVAAVILILCYVIAFLELWRLFTGLFACGELPCPPNHQAEQVAITCLYGMGGILLGYMAGGILDRIHRHRQSQL